MYIIDTFYKNFNDFFKFVKKINIIFGTNVKKCKLEFLIVCFLKNIIIKNSLKMRILKNDLIKKRTLKKEKK